MNSQQPAPEQNTEATNLLLQNLDARLQAAETKRAQFLQKHLIPVILVTALNDAHHRLSGVRVGANGYLTKPFTPDQLLTRVRDVLSRGAA